MLQTFKQVVSIIKRNQVCYLEYQYQFPFMLLLFPGGSADNTGLLGATFTDMKEL